MHSQGARRVAFSRSYDPAALARRFDMVLTPANTGPAALFFNIALQRAMSARVLLVCNDLQQSDLLMAELTDVGLDATPAFSADEAIGMLSESRFEAVVLSEELDDGLVGLVRWMGKRHKGLVVTLPERTDVDFALDDVANAGVVAKLVAALGGPRDS